MVSVFAYGTLMYQPLWLKVVEKHSVVPAPAVLDGFYRSSIKAQSGCTLVSSTKGRVSGMLYNGLSESDLALIDQHCEALFERVLVTVETPTVRNAAYCYLLRAEFSDRVEQRHWDQRHFELAGLSHLLAGHAAQSQAVKDTAVTSQWVAV